MTFRWRVAYSRPRDPRHPGLRRHYELTVWAATARAAQSEALPRIGRGATITEVQLVR